MKFRILKLKLLKIIFQATNRACDFVIWALKKQNMAIEKYFLCAQKNLSVRYLTYLVQNFPTEICLNLSPQISNSLYLKKVLSIICIH